MAWRGSRPLAGVALTSALMFSAGAALAAQATDSHPARLRVGTCAEVGDRAFELAAVGAALTADGTPAPVMEQMGTAGAPPVLRSVTILEASLVDLVEQGLVLIVAESAERPGQAIACGEVGGLLASQMAGMVRPGDELAIGLREQNDSGYAGIALVTAEGATTSVRIYLGQGLFETEPAADDQPDD